MAELSLAALRFARNDVFEKILKTAVAKRNETLNLYGFIVYLIASKFNQLFILSNPFPQEIS